MTARPHMLRVRLSTEEAHRLHRAAADAGMTDSAYVRQMCSGDQPDGGDGKNLSVRLMVTTTAGVIETLNEAFWTGLYGSGSLSDVAARFLAERSRQYALENNPRAKSPPGERRAQLARRKSATRRR